MFKIDNLLRLLMESAVRYFEIYIKITFA